MTEEDREQPEADDERAARFIAEANATSAKVDRAARDFVRAWDRWRNAQERAKSEADRLADSGHALLHALLDVPSQNVHFPLVVGRAVIDHHAETHALTVTRAHRCRRPRKDR